MSIFLAQIFVIFREGSAWFFWRDTECRFAGYEKDQLVFSERQQQLVNSGNMNISFPGIF